MSKILFTVLVVCLAQVAFARVARQSAATTTTASPLSEFLDGAKDLVDGVHNATLSLFGVKSDDEFFAKGKELFTTYQKTLESNVAQLNTETKDVQGKAKDLYDAFATKVTQVANELKAKNPEFFSGDVAKLQGAADSAFRTVVQESQKLKTRLEAEGQRLTPQIQATIKQITDSVQKTATELKTNAEAAINNSIKKN